jgi:hypothetical protein
VALSIYKVTAMNDLLKAALEYKQAGLSVIAVRGNKQSLHSWKKFQNEIISDELLVEAFSNSEAKGIAIICGSVSDNLEVMDMDSKYDLTGTLFKRYCESLNSNSPKLFRKLPIATTRNNGYHFFYRCPEIGKYKALASRHCTYAEKRNNPAEKVKVLIELKAEGGYVIVHPTIGYRFIQNNLKDTPLITPVERQSLFAIARSFNEYHEPEPIIVRTPFRSYDPDSPFDDYNTRGDIINLLQRHGWKIVRNTPVKTYFRRPGITDHDTSGDYNHRLGLFGVFSPNTDFKVGKGYMPYQVYAILECNRDFRLAAKRLLAEGYGVPYNQRC